MSASVAMQTKFYGLVELDYDGRVVYARPEGNGDRAAAQNLTGLNLYTEVAPFNNVREFQQRLDEFGRSSLQADTIDFTCEYDDGPVRVRVLMARIRERSGSEVTKAVLVHIRKAH